MDTKATIFNPQTLGSMVSPNVTTMPLASWEGTIPSWQALSQREHRGIVDAAAAAGPGKVIYLCLPPIQNGWNDVSCCGFTLAVTTVTVMCSPGVPCGCCVLIYVEWPVVEQRGALAAIRIAAS